MSPAICRDCGIDPVGQAWCKQIQHTIDRRRCDSCPGYNPLEQPSEKKSPKGIFHNLETEEVMETLKDMKSVDKQIDERIEEKLKRKADESEPRGMSAEEVLAEMATRHRTEMTRDLGIPNAEIGAYRADDGGIAFTDRPDSAEYLQLASLRQQAEDSNYRRTDRDRARQEAMRRDMEMQIEHLSLRTQPLYPSQPIDPAMLFADIGGRAEQPHRGLINRTIDRVCRWLSSSHA